MLAAGSVVLGILVAGAACGDDGPPPSKFPVTMERAFRGDDIDGCAFGSPVRAGELVIIATVHGIVTAYDHDGGVRWQTTVAALTPGDRAWIAATPVVVDDPGGDRLVFAWQDATATGRRHAHYAGVIDVATGALDPMYPPAKLGATVPGFDSGTTVTFNDATAFTRSSLVAAGRKIYISSGNVQDIQPWHGWMFELDLDEWRAGRNAIANVLLTTPEADCGPPGESGADDMICGGGIWAPSGPVVVGTPPNHEIWVPTGNGILDLDRRDYANTIMRVPAGMAFDPGCDMQQCTPFDPVDPARGCMESCRHLFMSRLRDGDPPLTPPMSICDGLTLLQCYAKLDLDLGANSPVFIEQHGKRFGVLPSKDGAIYLFDADHFGTMYDRLHVRDFCGTNGGSCSAHWAGTMVTQPTIAIVDGAPLIAIPTFYFDETNPGGVVAVSIDPADGGGFALREQWTAPERGSDEAVSRFREHTGRATTLDVGGRPVVVVGDPGAERTDEGLLFAIDAATGDISGRAKLDGPGHKYILPVVRDGRVFISSCETLIDGPTHVEAWDLAR